MASSIKAIARSDLVIIGGGPAGLAAALTYARVKRSGVVYDSKLYRNAHTDSSHTIPGFDGSDPMRYKAKVRAVIERSYGDWIEFRDSQVLRVTRGREDGRFEVEDAAGRKVLARKVIIATGIQDNLPAIPGIKETWGKRAIHCVFCDGTETASEPIGFLVTPNQHRFNPMIIEGALKMWSAMKHPSVHILTHGMDPSDPDDLAKSGLDRHMNAIKKKGWEVIADRIESVDEGPTGLVVRFQSSERSHLALGHIVVMPESWSPNRHAAGFLTPELLDVALGPMGTIPSVDPTDIQAGSPMPLRMGDDSRTTVPGLFWAGNVGSIMANVNICVAQGQAAGVMAVEELGKEDLAKLDEA